MSWQNTLDWDAGEAPLKEYNPSGSQARGNAEEAIGGSANGYEGAAQAGLAPNSIEMQATSSHEEEGGASIVPGYTSTSALVAQIMSAPPEAFVHGSGQTSIEMPPVVVDQVQKENWALSTWWEKLPFHQLWVEFLGSFFLCWFVVIVGYNPDALHIVGFAAATLTYLSGHISGGHFNPSISIAMHIRGKINRDIMWMYIVVQTLGAIIGSMISFGFYANTPIGERLLHKPFLLEPHQAFGTWDVAFVEFFYTFLLCLVFMTLTSTRANQDNDHYELLYGAYYASAIAVCCNITKGFMNPAMAFGLLVNTALEKGVDHQDEVGKKFWVYLLFELLAAVVAGVWFRIVNRKDNNHGLTPPLGRNQNLHMQGTQPEM